MLDLPEAHQIVCLRAHLRDCIANERNKRAKIFDIEAHFDRASKAIFPCNHRSISLDEILEAEIKYVEEEQHDVESLRIINFFVELAKIEIVFEIFGAHAPSRVLSQSFNEEYENVQESILRLNELNVALRQITRQVRVADGANEAEVLFLPALGQ